MLHAEEPLCGELGLDGHVGALGESHLVGVVLDLLHQSRLVEVATDLLAHVHAVESDIESGGLRDGAVVEDVDGLQVVLQSEGVVVDIVGRCHLEAARTKLDIDVAVLDDGDRASHLRHDDVLALEPRVLGVVGVDTHGRVAHDGLGARGGHYGVPSAVVAVHDVGLVLALHARLVLGRHVVFQIVELAVLLLIDHLLVGEGRLGLRVPVDHAYAAIDESLLVEIDKDMDDALRPLLVHREGRAVPVAGGAETAQLLEDDATVLVGPVPGMAEKLLTGEVALLDALLGQSCDDLGLRGDARMVRARHPAGVLSLHARAAHEDILNGVVEHVAHVEHTRHVGRRDDHRVGLSPVGPAAEELVVQPILIPFRLHFPGVIFRS